MPSNLKMQEIKDVICKIEGVLGVHHIHVWSIDGYNNYATMHIVTDDERSKIKQKVRKELEKFDIVYVTLELEKSDEQCHHQHCHIEHRKTCTHHHHH